MKILGKLRNRQLERRERGMASLMYIFLITVIAGYLGFAMDSALGNYTANGLKNAVDNAVIAASNQTTYKGNKQVISSAQAKETFSKYYDNYRKAYPNVTVKGKYKLTKWSVAPSRGAAKGINNTLTVSIVEKSNTRFLALLGTSEFTYNIKSTARLGSLYEKN